MKRKMGRRTKEEIAQDEALGIKRMNADEELAQQMGESPATIQRYKTLNKLVPELQDLGGRGEDPGQHRRGYCPNEAQGAEGAGGRYSEGG